MMISAARRIAMGELLFLGLSSVVGAVPMLLHPTGAPLHLPLSVLQYSPFNSFLIPGVVLLISNGLLSFIVLWAVFNGREEYGWWIMGQGAVLAGWLLVEMIMLRGASWLHGLYGIVAGGLLWTGWILRDPITKSKSRQTRHLVV